jgi:hypothetical protein
MAMKRALAGLLGILLAANGAAMVAAGRAWRCAAPHLDRRIQPHFVKNIGMAYLVAALGLGGFAARPRQGWSRLFCEAAFLSLHGLIHVADAIGSLVCRLAPAARAARCLAAGPDRRGDQGPFHSDGRRLLG